MIEFRDSLYGITGSQLGGFFHEWKRPPTAANHYRILQNSEKVVLAVDSETSRVIGFTSAITDGSLTAFIPYLEVIPQYRGQGIGSELVRRMLAKLEGFYAVDLVCDPDLRRFYEKLGFKAALAMSQRNLEGQG